VIPNAFHGLQLAARCLAEPATFDFLKPVSQAKDKEIATDPRRISVVHAAPFETHLFKPQRPDAIELALDRWCILSAMARAGLSAGTATHDGPGDPLRHTASVDD
jgi:hypothetical protein